MDELLQEFLTETNESIALLDVELVNLEQNPENPGLIDNIFRLVHTIKGTCGFLGLPRLEKVAHASENVLGKVRDGELAVSPAAVSLVLASIDQIKALLGSLEMTEKEPPGDDSDLIGKLNHLAETGEVPGAPVAAAPAEKPAAAPAEKATAKPAKAAKKPAPKKAAAKPKKAAAEPAAAEDEAAAEDGDAAKFDPELGRELLPGEVSLAELDAIFAATEVAPEAAPAPVPAATAPTAKAGQVEESQERGESAIANQSIRVNVTLLENLMTMVSELVLTRNQLLQMVRGQEGSAFTVPLQRLSHCTSELQENVMKTRMQPIGNAWAKLPRIVRDLGMELGKKIQLDMHGQETELDRQVLDLIKDPLTHMVRNSADHGLEMPDARRANGKSETGHIRLNAFHEGGHIIITVADDGKGLSTEGIRRKAVEKGMVSEAEAATLTPAQVQQFIFKPGFSTAASVTSVSGRGVGMDVVRTNIEKIGGTIELRSEEGRGTAFTIKIPLTLAIVSALIVECAGERYAIPQLSVVELVRTATNSEMRIEQIQDTPVLRLRNRLLPLVFLSKVLDLAAIEEKREAFVVVVQVGSAQFGIVVDGVFDTEEIVVKPVAPVLRDISVFGGNTILGDGSVIMILDVNGIAGTLEDMQMEEKLAEEEEERHRATTDESTSLLLFRAGGAEPKAVPLGLVARLEELPVESIEHVDGRDMVQYRGALMPLLRMRQDVAVRDSGRQPVLVFADGERTMGLIVDEILDIVEAELKVEMASEIDGIVGTAVIAGKATELLDLGYYLQAAFGDWFNSRREKAYGATEATRRILLVDDSPFFRNMLTPILGAAGYNVTAVGSADEALALRNKGLSFDIIVSDIEMPGMNGFDFAAEVRRSPDWQSVPLIALSSHATQHDFEQGRTVGFSDYIAKFDRDALLSVLSHTLGEAA